MFPRDAVVSTSERQNPKSGKHAWADLKLDSLVTVFLGMVSRLGSSFALTVFIPFKECRS